MNRSFWMESVSVWKHRLWPSTDLKNDKAVSFVAPPDDLRVRRILEHSSMVSEWVLQARAASLTCTVSEPGVTVSRMALSRNAKKRTKSLELFALAMPMPMPPSILSSSRIRVSGRYQRSSDRAIQGRVVELRVEKSDEFHPRLETARMSGECKSRRVRPNVLQSPTNIVYVSTVVGDGGLTCL